MVLLGTWAGALSGCNCVLPADPADGGMVCSSPRDRDGDGYSAAEGDCDDLAPTVFPTAPEICDGRDNDCDGLSTGEEDGDGDGAWACLDCNDGDPAIHPEAVECPGDGLDNDCDGARAWLEESDLGSLLDPARADVELTGFDTVTSVRVADMDGDGELDLLVGDMQSRLQYAPEKHEVVPLPGAVYVFYGPFRDGTRSVRDALGIFGDEPGEELGRAICTMDLDGDGAQELFIGAPLATGSDEEGAPRSAAGQVYGISHPRQQLSGVVLLPGAAEQIFRVEGEAALHNLGASLACQQLASGGKLFMGAPGVDYLDPEPEWDRSESEGRVYGLDLSGVVPSEPRLAALWESEELQMASGVRQDHRFGGAGDVLRIGHFGGVPDADESLERLFGDRLVAAAPLYEGRRGLLRHYNPAFLGGHPLSAGGFYGWELPKRCAAYGGFDFSLEYGADVGLADMDGDGYDDWILPAALLDRGLQQPDTEDATPGRLSVGGLAIHLSSDDRSWQGWPQDAGSEAPEGQKDEGGPPPPLLVLGTEAEQKLGSAVAGGHFLGGVPHEVGDGQLADLVAADGGAPTAVVYLWREALGRSSVVTDPPQLTTLHCLEDGVWEAEATQLFPVDSDLRFTLPDGPVRLLERADLDGDGFDELIVGTREQVRIFRGAMELMEPGAVPEACRG